MRNLLYKTNLGKMLVGDSVEIAQKYLKKYYKGKFQLIITSPPFPLNAKKKYGNLKGKEYKEWFTSLAPIFDELLAEDGSLVIEIGNAWEDGRPIQSLLHLECLMGLVNHPEANLRLIQEFIAYNPSKLPSPAQWVTVNRLRAVDSYTHVWWLAKSDYPKADNSKVLRPYSKSMKSLLKRQSYNSGSRPSEHDISKSGFLKDNGGSISHNLFELEPIDENREVRLPHSVLSFSNTSSNDFFLRQCRERGIKLHPARMQAGLISFFTQFLTEEDDLILDPFAGSNTTGYVAEMLNRRWIATEIDPEYAKNSMIRFEDPELNVNLTKN
ncbi:DNA-methyltransferase [Psychrobacter lutiphocae]|uniref:DNA-methyltransferase n=1 Tax=Psychrobacter lutiphocae TaxID=540500 RepID=UPI0003695BEC|nr:site-specific DNA-methyltransferase [Psychrobacter lutiphocae]